MDLANKTIIELKGKMVKIPLLGQAGWWATAALRLG